jgi:plasmid stabilization system protein ParE
MTSRFLLEAELELGEIALRYDSAEPGLGLRFLLEVESVVARVVHAPLLWRERLGGYRRVNCPVFPHYVAYIIRGEEIVIVAVAHGQQRPNYFLDRF